LFQNRNENGYDEKLEILLLYKGFFSAEQVKLNDQSFQKILEK
jgi:hypothetical protein